LVASDDRTTKLDGSTLESVDVDELILARKFSS
jgi:hypothetical protein